MLGECCDWSFYEILKLITDFFDYRSVEQRRKEFLRSIFSGLQEAGELQEERSRLSFWLPS